MKIISFVVPCFNSAAYMRACIDSLLPAADEAEIILVDDGSTDETARAIRYAGALPEDSVFGWKDAGHLHLYQNFLMHSLIYRTQILRSCRLRLPEHTFYVDNLFAYLPLSYVRNMYYMNRDLYHYLIGRKDQSVNEKVMIGRIDQQIRVTDLMIDSCDLTKLSDRHMDRYMRKYLAMICFVTSVMLTVSGTEENRSRLREFWRDFQKRRPEMYRMVRRTLPGIAGNLQGKWAESAVTWGYRKARRIFKFN